MADQQRDHALLFDREALNLGGFIMRRLLLLVLMLGAVGLIGSAPLPTGKAQAPQKEVAFVEFPDQVKLLGVFLRGQYVILHDHERMARGENCTYVYSRKAGQPDKLVASFHCVPVARKKAEHFTVRTSRFSNLIPIPEVREIQFAGSSEAHQVPTD